MDSVRIYSLVMEVLVILLSSLGLGHIVRRRGKLKTVFCFFFSLALTDLLSGLYLIVIDILEITKVDLSAQGPVIVALYRTIKIIALFVMISYIYFVKKTLDKTKTSSKLVKQKIYRPWVLGIAGGLLFYVLVVIGKDNNIVFSLAALCCYVPLSLLFIYCYQACKTLLEKSKSVREMWSSSSPNESRTLIAAISICIQGIAYFLSNVPMCLCLILEKWGQGVPKHMLLSTRIISLANVLINCLTYFGLFLRIARFFDNQYRATKTVASTSTTAQEAFSQV